MADNIEKTLRIHIDEATRRAGVLEKNNQMFVAEPLALDIMIIAEHLGRALMCCDILRVDFGRDIDSYEKAIDDVNNTAYDTYRALTGCS